MAKNNHSIGNAGEFYVLAQLAQRGYIADMAEDLNDAELSLVEEHLIAAGLL